MNYIVFLAQISFFMLGSWYFLSMILSGSKDQKSIDEEDKAKCEKLNKLDKISLGTPLTENARPEYFDEIIGQEKAIKSLKVALCGKNPQNILIYGPPGVGKTAAARIALKEAKLSIGTPFLKDAKFVELDATTLRFDERSFADPLIGSVHDPIYQGAGSYGQTGVPNPKEGAVSKAHGGVLFIDEIGELAPAQMNKLLKVLEDRRVFFESAYYSKSNTNIPRHIHNIFQNGLPADFRLIGATTRTPSEIPAALRSRCVEIHFLPLGFYHIMQIVENAVLKLGIKIDKEAAFYLCSYISNGRDAVKIIETLYNLLYIEKRFVIKIKDVKWAISNSRYEKKMNAPFCKIKTNETFQKTSPDKIIDMKAYLQLDK